MKNLLLLCLAFALCACGANENDTMEASSEKTSTTETQVAPDYAMVIHGGAGTILKKNMTPEKEAGIREAMNAALNAGEAVLKAGGSAADAVEATI